MSGATVAALACGVLLGSIPVAWILVRLTAGKDIARSGSRNVGALNALRVARSRWVGGAVLAADALKGVAAVAVARLLEGEAAAGLIGVVAGHCYNPWLSLAARRLTGGKGFAAAAGAVLVLFPWLVVAWFAIGLVAWVLFFLWRRIKDEAPASAVATIGVVPCAAWLHGERALIALAVSALLILPKLAKEVWGLLWRPEADG